MIRLIVSVCSFVALFYTCAPSPDNGAEASGPKDQEYALTAARPIEFLDESSRFGVLRLSLEEDSARLFDPFTDYETTVAAFAGQRPTGRDDSLYLEYTLEADSTLNATWHSPTQRYALRFAAVAPVAAGYWPDSLVGQTFMVKGRADSLVVHLAELNNSSGNRYFMSHLMTVEDDGEREVGARTSGYGFSSDERIHAVFDLPGDRAPGQMRRPLAFPGLLADGTPVLYVMGRDTINPVPIDTLALQPFPSLLPETMAAKDLLELLNRGRVQVMELPEEPDSIGIAYQVEPSQEHDPILTRDELPGLDVSFAEDGGFTLFAGDRIVRQGRWALSPDRNFMLIMPDQSAAHGLTMIQAYRDDYIAIPFPLEVETLEPRGVRLRSYYRPMTELRFYKN
ncbi:hypothetical protein [Lewinella sp. IMCC34191]|uniref:hypothetical protein n=1 Tax=Lewinella sp. IMCC34191 TaxID=2259172 RepID=UPI000E2259BF|nr:hypothetical protein [Lewinella sp. IMCC34191]